MLPTIPKKNFEYRSAFVPKGKLTLQPFTVGQESVLIQAKDEEDERAQLTAIKQIIDESIVTKGINSEDLPMFVFEEIFLRLRQQSAGEIVDLKFTCDVDVGETKCNAPVSVAVDLREMKVKEYPEHTNKIIIQEPYGIQMKYPTIETFSVLEDVTDENELIVQCIDMIFDDENVYTREDASDAEFMDFWNQLTIGQKKEIFEKFWFTIPHLHYEKEVICPKCGTKHVLEFNSLNEIFQ